ncbi:hypothetical protein AMTR_s00088p00100860 [Amborella trichopoda]|uniref:Uncharacterized protein n=1 Tax=Amborella trichopoda TaxID=13333 RepID=W1NW38_AMBTC|nr:hypothetical protein AMTR_s00088p00100860 [Amborella trichopoda]
MVMSSEWQVDRGARSPQGKEVKDILLRQGFWTRCREVVIVTKPLVHVLRLVDVDLKPAMGFLYDAMRWAREAIACSGIFVDAILPIVDSTLQNQMHHDIHAAEEDYDDFDEGIDEDDDGDDGEMRDDWREPTVIECEVSQGTRTSTVEEEGLRLVQEEVKSPRPSSYTPGQRCTGRGHCRLIIQGDKNDDERQNTGQGGEEHEQFQSLITIA